MEWLKKESRPHTINLIITQLLEIGICENLKEKAFAIHLQSKGWRFLAHDCMNTKKSIF